MYVKIPISKGELELPKNSKSLVVFAHGSGSSRFSPRNLFVAEHLQHYLMGTLLIDLLTSPEEQADQYSQVHRFDIGLLTQRLLGISKWLQERAGYAHLKACLFWCKQRCGSSFNGRS